MRTVLIADKDNEARAALRKMLRKSGVQADAVLECADAERLLEILARYPIDILFTEVSLPGMSVEEMLQRIRDMHLNTHLVAVTGSASFADAVRLLRAGAMDYLLKPPAQEQVEKIMEHLAEEEALRRKTLKSSLRYLTWFLWGEGKNLQEEEREQFIADNDGLFLQEAFRVCVIGSREELQSEQVIMLRRGSDQRVCIVEERDLQPFLLSAQDTVCAGVSSLHRGLSELSEAYEEAASMREYAFCLCRTVRRGEDDLPFVGEALKEADARLLGEAAHLKRIQLIGTGKTQELYDEWAKLFQAARTLHIEPGALVRELTKTAEEIPKVYPGRLTEEQLDILKSVERIFSYPNLDAVQDEMLSVVYSLSGLLSREKAGSSASRMKLAVEYIQEYYYKDLTMAMVSNYISMNYSFFSVAFKEYTGTNFVTYLRDIRIKKARSLLETTQMKVSEVANAVGYKDDKHFMRLFKTSCGVSPSEYRKNYSYSE